MFLTRESKKCERGKAPRKPGFLGTDQDEDIEEEEEEEGFDKTTKPLSSKHWRVPSPTFLAFRVENMSEPTVDMEIGDLQTPTPSPVQESENAVSESSKNSSAVPQLGETYGYCLEETHCCHCD
jgi:hypothetical protein